MQAVVIRISRDACIGYRCEYHKRKRKKSAGVKHVTDLAIREKRIRHPSLIIIIIIPRSIIPCMLKYFNRCSDILTCSMYMYDYARPRPHWGNYQHSPRPLCHHGRGTPPHAHSPSCQYIYRTPLFQKSWTRPCTTCVKATCYFILHKYIYTYQVKTTQVWW